MSPMQQIFLGLGAVAKKTYVDDIFSTYVYTGNETSGRAINNGIDLSGKGGLVWVKSRNDTHQHHLFDTVRGANDMISSDSNSDEATVANRVTAFNNNGFTLGSAGQVNGTSSYNYTSWTFRKSSAFTIKEYTGSGSTQSISHDLGSVPGCIMIKRTDDPAGWAVYHRGVDGTSPEDYALGLDNSDARSESANYWDDTAPTATHFTVKTSGSTNTSGATYIAYIFAGGESTAATARSVEFDGSNDGLGVANSSDFSFGSGDFTVEGWFKLNQMSSQNGIVNVWKYSENRRSWVVQTDPASAGGALEFFVNSGGGSGTNHRTAGGTLRVGDWFHFAGVRDGNTIKLFVNGDLVDSTSYSSTLYDNTNDPLVIGSIANGTEFANASISNIRITKGQAIYTSNFRVPTEPLTTTSQGAVASNVKLLCCNNSSVTGSTKTPTTISTFDSPTASSDSPFDDPAGFTFGENEDQEVIKCGSYTGNGVDGNGPEVYLGWEPQWILIKRSDAVEDWVLFDTMRGVVTNDKESFLIPNTTAADSSGASWFIDFIDITSTGFKLKSNYGIVNADGGNYSFTVLRRPDGYCGKPPELGTGVFTMDTGASTSANTIPDLDSGFPVDLALIKHKTADQDWHIGTRLQGTKKLNTNLNASESTSSNQVWDSNLGCWKNLGSNYQGWMWKRHAGFDVVAYEGNGTAGKQVIHSLSKTPEMIWIKNRGETANWIVYHKGSNGGTNPEKYYLRLNTDDAEIYLPDLGLSTTLLFNDTAPTSSVVTLGNSGNLNKNGFNHLMMLFASANDINGNPISKVGSYTGNGTSGHAITVGFQPRLLIVKSTTQSASWIVLDTTRGWGSGDDEYLSLDTNAAQNGLNDFGAPTSTGFTLNLTGNSTNGNGEKYIYYAHA